jgi:hypothetical protein
MNALFSLCTSIHDLGIVLVQKRRTQISSQALRCFIAGVLEAMATTSISYDSSFERQILVDLIFLKQIAELWDEDNHWADSLKLLNERIEQVQIKVCHFVTLSAITVLITWTHFSSALMVLWRVVYPTALNTCRELKFFLKHYFPQIRRSSPILGATAGSILFCISVFRSRTSRTQLYKLQSLYHVPDFC